MPRVSRGSAPQNRGIATSPTLVAAIDGWLAYGAALNEGRALHPGDREFGRWMKENVLSQVAIAPSADEQAAAIWAAANADQLAEAE